MIKMTIQLKNEPEYHAGYKYLKITNKKAKDL